MDERKPSQPTGEDLTLLCGALNCVAYALIVGPEGITVDWVRGSIAGDVPIPIRAMLTGKLRSGCETVAAHLNRLKDGNRSEAQLLWRSEKASFPIRDIALPEFDRHGCVSRIVGTVRDVSDEVWIRQQHAADVWKDRIYDHLDIGVSCWNTKNKLVFANRQFRDLDHHLSLAIRPGTSSRRLVASIASSHRVLIEGDRAAWVRRTLQNFERERPQEFLLSDGRWIEVTTTRFAEGTIARTLDVTSQKGGERALRQAKEIAETANLKKSRFLRAANHDLRQPLATLKILIYSSFEIQNEVKRREILHSMDITVGIMDEILGSLLQIGQLDAGRIVSKVSHFQIKQVIDRLCIEFTPQAEAKGLELRAVESYETVLSDRALLERILSNFIANAIRFTEKGTILIGPRRRGSSLELQVWDTGCGIAEDQLELIFEEFHQVGGQGREQQRGLGLGLNIALRLAQLLGHSTNVRSEINKGSVFSVTVPFGDIWQSDLGEPEISERIGGEFLNVKMLVIEDNELLRNTVCSMLEKWGVKVTEASDAEQAVSVFSEKGYDFDLALVDYRLPSGRAGTEVLEELRKKSGRGLPGIVTTADNDPELITHLRAEGLPVLIKPINPVRLRSVMHYLLYEQDRSHSVEKLTE